MLLYYNHTGQLCNRLWSIVPLLAYVLEKKEHLLVLNSYDQYLSLFPNLRKCKYVHFCLNSSNLYPNYIGRHINRWIGDRNYDIDLSQLSNSGWITYVDGYMHRYDVSFIGKHYREIVSLLKPDFVSSITKKGGGEVLVGVHIRRGDYKEFLGGRLYFENETYLKYMEALNERFLEEGRTVKFIVCSNETVKFSNTTLNICQNTEGGFIGDLITLSSCDYILGPYSTYSQWASFIGEKPIFVLNNKDEVLDMEKFSPVIRFDLQKNGNKL